MKKITDFCKKNVLAAIGICLVLIGVIRLVYFYMQNKKLEAAKQLTFMALMKKAFFIDMVMNLCNWIKGKFAGKTTTTTAS